MDDLARIRFVTTRYRQLRGLHIASWGGLVTIYLAFLLFSGLEDLRRRDAFDGLFALLFLCLPAGFAHAYLRHYYQTRFGRLDEEEEFSWDGLLLGAIGCAVLVQILGALVGLAAMFPVWAAIHGSIAVRDARYRSHHLIGVGGSLIAMAFLWIPKPPTPRGVMMALLVFHAALAVVGLLDHRLLVRTLGGRWRPEAERTMDGEILAASSTRPT